MVSRGCFSCLSLAALQEKGVPGVRHLGIVLTRGFRGCQPQRSVRFFSSFLRRGCFVVVVDAAAVLIACCRCMYAVQQAVYLLYGGVVVVVERSTPNRKTHPLRLSSASPHRFYCCRRCPRSSPPPRKLTLHDRLSPAARAKSTHVCTRALTPRWCRPSWETGERQRRTWTSSNTR